VKQRIILIVAIALSATPIVHAETEEGRQACMNDAFQFCQEFIPDRERVFRCLESRKQQISAACRANMPAEPAPERAAAKKHAPQTKSAKRKAPAVKSTSAPAARPTVKKHAPQTKSTTAKTPAAKTPAAKAPAAKAPAAKRASNSAPPGSKPLNLAPR
jgi:hypothetical protein